MNRAPGDRPRERRNGSTTRAATGSLAALGFGLPLLYDLARKLRRREFGSDPLGDISIVTSILLGEDLAGSIIVPKLSSGEALESHALASASTAW